MQTWDVTNLSANTWDIHAHAVPGEMIQPASLSEFGMDYDGKALFVSGQRLFVSGLLDANWLHRTESRACHSLLSVPPALLRYDLDATRAEIYTMRLNDGLTRLCQTMPGLWGLAYLPLTHPDLAIAEIEARSSHPWLGYVMGTSVGDMCLDDAALDPVYAALNMRRAIVFVHPLKSPDARLDAYYLENLLGNPYETGLSMASLMLSGKLCKFPEIKFIFAHGGGVLPQILGRLQRGYDTRRPGLEGLSQRPLDLARQLYVDCIVHSGRALEMCISAFGLDHILPGTDAPFPMGQSVESALIGLPHGEREAIFQDNFQKLLAADASDREC